tara:strand:+ start:419 stop:1435 length:1017 start_codon:yes stop_codon:yes gene_type:complete
MSERDLKIALSNELAVVKDELKLLKETKTTENDYLEFCNMAKDQFNAMNSTIRDLKHQVENQQHQLQNQQQNTDHLPVPQIITDIRLSAEIEELKDELNNEKQLKRRWREKYKKCFKNYHYQNVENETEMKIINDMTQENFLKVYNKIDKKKNELIFLLTILSRRRVEKNILNSYLYLQKDYSEEDIGIKNYCYTRKKLVELVENNVCYTTNVRDNKKYLAEILQNCLLKPAIEKLQARFRYKKKHFPIRLVYSFNVILKKLQKTFPNENIQSEFSEPIADENGHYLYPAKTIYIIRNNEKVNLLDRNFQIDLVDNKFIDKVWVDSIIWTLQDTINAP